MRTRQCRCRRLPCSTFEPILSAASESVHKIGGGTWSQQSRANLVNCDATLIPATDAHISAYAVLSAANEYRRIGLALSSG